MAGYTPNYGPPGTEPEHVRSRKRDNRTRQVTSPQRMPDHQLIAKDSTLSLSHMFTPPNIAAYPSRYGRPGTEPDHVGSFNRDRRARRSPSPPRLTDRQLVDKAAPSERRASRSKPLTTRQLARRAERAQRAQSYQRLANPQRFIENGAPGLSSDITVPIIPTPETIDTSKTLKMSNKAQVWKKAYEEQLAASNPDPEPSQVTQMTHTAWLQYKSVMKQNVMAAGAERRAERFRHSQLRANPHFLQQREDRIAQFYNEVSFQNPKLTGDEIMEQAKILEKKEIVAASQHEILEKRKAKEARKVAIRTIAASQGGKMGRKKARRAKKARTRQGDQMAESFNKLSLMIERPEESQSDEEEYIPPSSAQSPQIQSRPQAKNPATEEYVGLPPSSPTQAQSRADAALARLSALHAERATNAQKKSDAAIAKLSQMRTNRAAKVVKTNDAVMARLSQMRAGQAAKGKKIVEPKAAKRDVKPMKNSREEEEALRRERLYQMAVKSDNMMRWLRQLTEEEPEEQEEMEL